MFLKNYSAAKIRLIDRVIRDIEDNTCIKFINRRAEDDYVNIQTDRMAYVLFISVVDFSFTVSSRYVESV